MAPSASGFPGGETPARPDLLRFVAEMGALQVDQLAALVADLGEPSDAAPGVARELVTGWRDAGYVESGQLTLGEPWIWATRRCLDALGLGSRLVAPSPTFLRHTHAVTDVRLAVQRTEVFRSGRAWWRAERLIRGDLAIPSRAGKHLPDGEVHWPAGSGSPWAGQTWAIEVQLSPGRIKVFAAIMTEHLTSLGDLCGPPASTQEPGRRLRYARLVYACSPRAIGTVLRAKALVGTSLADRIDVHDLPESAMRLRTPKRGWEP
jgi:hypothetical protein